MPYVDIAGDRIFYVCQRVFSPGPHNLILVHGAGGTHQHWGRQLRSIRNAATYALDLPGHGRSSGEGHDTIEGYAATVIGFVDALRLERATIAGHSMGSAVALWMACHHPTVVEALVLVGGGARLRVLPRILEGITRDYAATVQFIVENCYGENATEEELRRGQLQMKAVDPMTMHRDFLACNAFDMTDSLSCVCQPTLAITGTQDTMTPPEYGVYLSNRIPHAELLLVEGAGHMAMMEEAEIVTQAIRDFLDSLPDRQGSEGA